MRQDFAVDARRRAGRALGLGMLVLVGLAQAAMAAEATVRVVENPRVLGTSTPGAKAKLLAAPLQVQPKYPGEKRLDLNIVYTDSRLWNPAMQRWDKVRLRSYNGTDVSPDAPYVAPTIEVNPGETVRVSLHNQLPADPSCAQHSDDPHCFNGTNLHTHGLWVSPTGNSDNVLLSIDPGASFQYEYNIPADHPAGTFWYHTHRHGSTALQVASGMAGALIVRGSRVPSRTTNGDIDTLLRAESGAPMRERILLLQQIQYGCLDAANRLKVARNSAGKIVSWVCDPGDVGVIESYDYPVNDPRPNDDTAGFGPGDWAGSGRYTSINGQVLPTFKARAGEIERWRIIHGGVRDTISLRLYPMKPQAPQLSAIKGGDSEDYIEEYCAPEPLPYHLIAADGLTMDAMQTTTVATLQPAYRYDALMVFPSAGKYCLIDASAPATGSVSQEVSTPQLMGIVEVAPGVKVQNVKHYLRNKLVAAAQRTMPESVKQAVVADLLSGLKLRRFIPHPDIADSEVTGTQELTFFIDTSGEKTKFEVSNTAGATPFKPQPYEMTRIDRKLMLGGVDEWTLESRFVGHPFHIHVNPFQVVKVLDPSGRDVSVTGALDDDEDPATQPDPQYPGIKGVWKDTLWVKSLIPSKKYPVGGRDGTYTVVVRTRYQRYIGEYVLHCHILDHEDNGMMQNVEVVLPGQNASTGAHHGH